MGNPIELEQMLLEVISLINESLKGNPFKSLDTALRIVQQRNYNHFAAIKRKVGDVIMALYGSQINNEELIIKKLDDIYKIIESEMFILSAEGKIKTCNKIKD